ncbi:SseB family protein [Paracoccus onubensis]|uniref:SseB protein N-terminal domain-containing protein n=1 Tax=Paracoccus onubensis TaxID=1675788 RepID=A0A418T4D5_9RHOB|nr:SseB family protein [Paracoccus onubensis]RJE88073.1 hypothetical protein D3P04_03930 [Paracoccus onubensis]
MTALDELAVVPFHDAASPQRARMLSRLADTELSVALAREPAGDRLELQIFPLESGPVALACDGEDRLAGFFGKPVSFAAMPGRVLAGLLQQEKAGLLVNPGFPSEMLLDAAMLHWLTDALAATPETDEARLRLTAADPATVEALAEPLAMRFADMSGLISAAALAGIEGENGPSGHILLIAGAATEHQPAIAKALAEALSFLPPQPGGVDISFSDTRPPQAALRFNLESSETPPAEKPKAPPRLR